MDQISIQVKHLTQKTYNLTLSKSSTVKELKNLLEKESQITAQEIKLIFKGKIFKSDSENLEELKVEQGSVLHMIHQKPEVQQQQPSAQQQTQQTQQQSQQQTQPQTTQQQTQQQNPFASFGIPNMEIPQNFNMDQLNQMMQNPMMRQMAQNLFSNPEQLMGMIQGNPQLQQMVGSNPEVQGLLSDPQRLQQMGNMLFSNPNQASVNLPQQQQIQQPQGNPEEIYAEQLQKLSEMGFTNREVNIRILQQCFGSVDAAVERLLGMFQ